MGLGPFPWGFHNHHRVSFRGKVPEGFILALLICLEGDRISQIPGNQIVGESPTSAVGKVGEQSGQLLDSSPGKVGIMDVLVGLVGYAGRLRPAVWGAME